MSIIRRVKQYFSKYGERGSAGAELDNLGLDSPIIVVILALVILMGYVLIGGALFTVPKQYTTGTQVIPDLQSSSKSQDSLQLYTFGFRPAPTGLPPARKTCPPESKKADCDCLEYEPVSIACPIPPASCPVVGDGAGFAQAPINGASGLYCVTYPHVNASEDPRRNTPGCFEVCISKPVIYLYPEADTLVDVEIVTPGRVYISDPLYPEGGWKNVLAHPDGMLHYEGKKYAELYYETSVQEVRPPKNGIVIPTAHLEERLATIIGQLGLRGRERKEFLAYWLPELYALHAPYILFSVVEADEKERIDHVSMSPKPDTFINFLAYFKPISQPFADIEALVLPSKPPARVGFTAVEWGGTIER